MRALFRGRWTDAKARRATLKLLGEIDDRLNELGYLWGDVDQFVVDQADERKHGIEALKTSLQGYWRERDAEDAGAQA